MRAGSRWIVVALALWGCGAPAAPPERVVAAPPRQTSPVVTISVVGTNDLHGHLRALPVFAGYLANLRRARAADGAVLLVDGGDLFQGTLESNLEEGASVVRAYEALGYDAATIGNHEFDYGPTGERATPREPGDDPRGALRARIAEADFPFLSANLAVRGQGRIDLGVPSVLLERAGIAIGVVGVTTEQTLTTTLAANVADLEMRPLAAAIEEEARALRARGASVVVVAAHAGGECRHFESPDDLSSCEAHDEIMRVAEALPPGAVDVIVAGHTHHGIAHRVHGIAIVESFSYGEAFGRVDLEVDRLERRVIGVRIHPPTRLCGPGGGRADDGETACEPGPYEGAPVVLDPRLAEVIAPSLARAAELRDRPLGPTLRASFERDRNAESSLGNLFVDLMLAARPGADLALANGGGLRADLPDGPLRYGSLYEAFPFDNRFARVRATAAEIAGFYAASLRRDGSFFSIGGLRVEARCEGGSLRVSLVRPDGRPVRDTETLTILTTDFVATGGDGLFADLRDRPGAVEVEDGEPVREEMVRVLAPMGELDPGRYLDPRALRVRFPGPRPVRCPG